MQERNGGTSRFTDVWVDAVAAEAAALEQHRIERRYRRMLAMTDGVLGRLEQRNLAGQADLDDVIRRDIGRMLSMLTPEARQRFPQATTVQAAVDGVFDVQGVLLIVLQRMLHWDRVLASQWEPLGAEEPVRRTA